MGFKNSWPNGAKTKRFVAAAEEYLQRFRHEAGDGSHVNRWKWNLSRYWITPRKRSVTTRALAAAFTVVVSGMKIQNGSFYREIFMDSAMLIESFLSQADTVYAVRQSPWKKKLDQQSLTKKRKSGMPLSQKCRCPYRSTDSWWILLAKALVGSCRIQDTSRSPHCVFRTAVSYVIMTTTWSSWLCRIE